MHTGKGDDLSIDGIVILINNFLATNAEDANYLINDQFKNKDLNIEFIFIQSKTSDNFDLGDTLKFFNGVESFFNPTGRSINSKIKNFIETQNIIFENSSRFNENPTLKLFYVALGKYTEPEDFEAIKRKTKKEFEDTELFSAIEIDYFDIKNVMDLHKNVELRIKKEIEIQRTTAFPTTDNIKEAYIGIASIKDFITLISDEDGNLLRTLFYDNVRDYQGKNPVNQEIIDTINSKNQKYFGFFNNGVTIVAKNLNKSGEKITIQDFQIVNGCQTSTIIHNNKEKINQNSFIPIKIIGTDDNEIINSIIRATNRQTEVKSEAFESLSVFHKELEEFYNHIMKEEENRLYYERRNKQYVQLDVPKSKVITLATQINSYLSVFKEQPHSTHRYYGELLKVNKMFNVNDSMHPYYTSSYLLYKVDELFRANKLDAKYKIFRYHIIMMLRKKISGDYTIQPNSKKNDTFCQKILDECKNNDTFLNLCNEICTKINNIIKKDFSSIQDYSKLQRIKEFTHKLLDQDIEPDFEEKLNKQKGLRIIKKAKDCIKKI